MALEEWKGIEPGDFILLDSCSLDSDRFNGRVMLTINGHRAFRAKLKDGTLKILELPLLHEVETPMVKKPEHEDEDDLSDLELPEDGIKRNLKMKTFSRTTSCLKKANRKPDWRTKQTPIQKLSIPKKPLKKPLLSLRCFLPSKSLSTLLSKSGVYK